MYYKSQTFSWFWLCTAYILIPNNMIILCFHLPYFHVSNNALFLRSTLVDEMQSDIVHYNVKFRANLGIYNALLG